MEHPIKRLLGTPRQALVFDLSVILETGIPFCIPKQGKYGQFLVKKPLEPLFTLCRNQGIYGVAGSKASNNLVLGSFPLKKIPTPPISARKNLQTLGAGTLS